MKQILLGIFLSITLFAFSQEPFRYDTIFVTPDDARNIHRYQNKQTTTVQNQQDVQSQQSKPMLGSGFDAKNLRYGLNLGMHFSDNYSLFRLAPQVGYQFNRYLMAGAGVSYYYSKNRIYHQQERVSLYNNSLGANLFGYFYPSHMLVVSVQPELNYVWSNYKGDLSGELDKANVLVPSFVVGAGLRLGPAHAMLYYDLVQDVNSPYSSGIFYGMSVYF